MTDADFAERAAILEYDGGLSRADAEAQALLEIYSSRIETGVPGILGELVAADRRRWHTAVGPILAALGLVDVRAPAWGFAPVVADGETYRPAIGYEAAHHAFIVPAVEGEGYAIADLVACTIVNPRRMRSRLGVATVVGADEIERAHCTGAPLYIFDDTARWLRAGALGAVIFDWKRGIGEIEGISDLICSSALAARLHDATRRLWPRPTIAFAAEKMRHAA